jgi:HSP20 family protein
MGNITVKRENVPRPQMAPTAEMEPRWFRSIFNWDPFREMSAFPMYEDKLTFAPAFEVKETKEGYIFKADVPGIKDKDLEVTVTGNRLTVSGHREAEHKEQTDTLYTYERSYGSFSRSFTLPDGADVTKCVADLRDGVLSLSIPRTPEQQPKKIDIKTPAQKS